MKSQVILKDAPLNTGKQIHLFSYTSGWADHQCGCLADWITSVKTLQISELLRLQFFLSVALKQLKMHLEMSNYIFK